MTAASKHRRVAGVIRMGPGVIALALIAVAPLVRAQEAKRPEREAMYWRYLEFASYVKGGSVDPHWMADGSSFWYAEGAPENTVIYKVDPKANTRMPLFDTARLRKALTPLLGHEPPYQGLPFEEFTFVDNGETAVKFTVEGKDFVLQLDTYAIIPAPSLSEEEKSRTTPQVLRKTRSYYEPEVREVLAPNGRWFVGLKDHNLWLRSTTDGRSVPLTRDGAEGYEWGYVRSIASGTTWVSWSPNGFKLGAKKVDSREVPPMPVIHWLKPEAEVEWFRHHPPLAGGPLPQTELFVVDILSRRQVRIDTGEEPDQSIRILGWRPDGSELLFLRTDRRFKKLDLMAGNPVTGSTRVVLTETQETFIPAWEGDRFLTLLEDGKKFVWLSERDGWNHLYLYDIGGSLIRRLTEGAFPLVRVVALDEKAGWVYFMAHGDQQRPYDLHLYRVSLESEGFTRITEATGQHDIELALSKEFFLDTHSTAARPPTVELKNADGTLLQTLSKANIDALKKLKWSPPEEFVVKAADGETDLWGVLYKPYDFDPNKKYPVIEQIYAGPQTTIVPRIFTHGETPQALAQLGFIVFRVDGRGTPHRGKAFQDVVYGNFGRHEIPDHVAALKQLAAERPYMDLSRVGIFGHSWGGNFTIRALLLAPDVYHVGVASAPGGEPYQGGDSYEEFIGLPQDDKEAYEYASNLRLVDNLRGKLLLVHGTSDTHAPFSATMQLVEALIRAGKPYDLIVLPEQGHGFRGASSTYFREARYRYFQEHLKP